MLRKIISVLLLCAGWTNMLPAQNPCSEKLDRAGIYLRYELFKGLCYVKDDQSRSVGFTYNKLAPEFATSLIARPLFKKAQRNSRIGTGISIATLLGTVGGFIIANRQITDQGYARNERKYRQGIGLIIGSATIGAAISFPFYFKARRQLDDALWLRNRDLLR